MNLDSLVTGRLLTRQHRAQIKAITKINTSEAITAAAGVFGFLACFAIFTLSL